MFVEIGMDSHRHIVADTHHSTKGISTQTHMSILAHYLKRLPFLLHGIGIVASTIEFQCRSLNLTTLSSPLALHQLTYSTDASTRCHLFQEFVVKVCRVNHHLDVFDSGTVIEGYEINSF